MRPPRLAATAPRRPSLRLSRRGHLRRCILLGLGVSVAGFLPEADAAPFGTPGWFAQQGAAAPAATSGAPATALAGSLPGGVTTPAAAMLHAERSMSNLNRAAEAIVAAQAAQAAARQLALDSPATVPDGLAAGGLQKAAAGTWLNAADPDATTADGATTVTVRQTAKKAILNWDSFNVGRATTLHIDQAAGAQTDGSNDWVALNRVAPGASPSRIEGTIRAEGTVYLINQNGIVFGGTARVNVHSLLASTLPLYMGAGTNTLKPGNDPDYLRRSDALFLETGITSSGIGTASGNILGIGSAQQRDATLLADLPGDIRVEAGAGIATGPLGFSLLAAPNIANAGSIGATEGQVILAAGVGVSLRNSSTGSMLLEPVLTGSIVDTTNGNRDVTPRSRLDNTGIVSAQRGDARLLGLDIRQAGIVVATTSVTRAGSITIAAQDGQTVDTAQARTGSLRLAPGSVTALLPDGNAETTISNAAADQVFKTGTITLQGGSVTVDNGALVEAPGQNVRIGAIGTGALVRASLVDGSIAGRVYLADGAVVDVSGLADVELPMSANLVTVPRIGQNELADTPEQRGGVLFGQPLTVDTRRTGVRGDGVSWTGTPLANVRGYVEQVPREIRQMLQNGGSLSLAGEEVITRSGSYLGLDGGFVHYLGGFLETTRLIAANGAVIDVGSADPNVAYVGVAGRFTDAEPRWNSTTTWINPLLGGQGMQYESDYLRGGNAGALNVYGHGTVLLEGELSAAAVAGRYQVADGKQPRGGRFYTGTGNSLLALAFPDGGISTSGPSYVLQDDSPDLARIAPGLDATTALPASTLAATDTANIDHWIPLSTRAIAAAGFWSVTVAADEAGRVNQGGEIVMRAGAGLRVQPGGSIALTASRITVEADLVAPAGSIGLTATGNTSVPGSTTRPLADSLDRTPGDIRVAAGVTLSARGEWVNDSGLEADAQHGNAFVNGGQITLRTYQFSVATVQGVLDQTGSIILDRGSLLDVSSGGRVLPSGQLAQKDGIVQGKGGNIALLAYEIGEAQFGGEGPPLPTDLPAQAARLQLDGELRGYGFSGGGTLALHALGLRIGDDAPARGAWEVVLPTTWFAAGGFASYRLSAEFDATITAGSVVRVTQANLLPDRDALLRAPDGSDLRAVDAAHPDGIYTRIGALDDYRRQAADLTLYAGDFLNWRTATQAEPDYTAYGITGTVLVDHGAAIVADARARITLGSHNQVTVLGSITAHGGSITLTGDTGRGGYAQVPGTLPLGVAYASDAKSVWLGASSVLDVSGIALIDPLQSPLAEGEAMVVPRTGTLLDGGSVTLSDDTGYIVVLGCRDTDSCDDSAAPGARIDVSGVADRFDLPASGALDAVTPQAVWSHAGSITFGVGAGLHLGGRLVAHGGSDQARGGSLAIVPLITQQGTTSGFAGAGRLIIDQRAGRLAATPVQPGESLVAALGDGQPRFAVATLDGSGIDTLALGTDPLLGAPQAPLPVVLGRDVTIRLDRALTINTAALTGGGGGAVSTVTLAAPYVGIHGYIAGAVYPRLAAPPVASDVLELNVAADTIDLGGQFTLRNFGQARFGASGDIRLVTPSSYDYYRSAEDLTAATAIPGVLLASGDLLFEAAQLYPATGNRFVIETTGEDGTVRFLGNARSAAAVVPMSAGGALLVSAAHIEQGGVLRAPAGEIVLGVADVADADTLDQFSYPTNNRSRERITALLPLVTTQSLRLLAGSVTSVSLAGRIVPYGETVDGQNWQYNGSATSLAGAATTVPSLSAPPARSILLQGAAVDLGTGALIDLAGGGDLQAQEWVAGTGGARDVLQQYNTVYTSGQAQQVPLYADARPVYAILPGFDGSPAPYDPAIVSGDPMIGKAVYLSGLGDLPAGVYTLLPAKYATVPGAWRVVQDTGARDALAEQNATLPDGTLLVAGRFVDGASGASDARGTAFLLQSGDVWRRYSEYSLTSADAFFGALAERSGGAATQLPRDAGQLVLAATQTLALGATLNTASAAGGTGALVDIAAREIRVVDALDAAIDGVQLRAADLNALDASSLLLGGKRRRTAGGDQVTALARHVVVDNGAATLSAPEILLVATATEDGDGVRVAANASIEAVGDMPAGRGVAITLGRLPVAATGNRPAVDGISGDGALLRVSNGGVVAVNRLDLPQAAHGMLSVEAGARIAAGQAITLDSAASTRVDASATIAARAIDANSELVSILGDGADAGAARGLVIGPRTLAQFAGAERVSLSSRGALRFLGDVTVTLAGDLALSAGEFDSDGGSVALGARTLTLGNTLDATPGSARAGGGTLSLAAGTVSFGPGDTTLAGFAAVDVAGSRAIAASGAGSVDFGAADVALHAPLVYADSAASGAWRTAGNMLIDRAGAQSASVPDAVGGALDITAASLGIDSRLLARSGSLNLRATQGDITLAATAILAADGSSRTFGDVTRQSGGGGIALRAERGSVIVPVGALLDFSAASDGGDAGALRITSGRAVRLDGTLAGAAASGFTGGTVEIDSADAFDLDAFAARLDTGIDGRIAVHAHAGELLLSAGNRLRAQAVSLVADAAATDGRDGFVTVLGSIDASGAKGGAITLFGSRGVALEGNLDAHGTAADERGGSVVIGTAGSGDGSTDATLGYRRVDATGSGSIVIGTAATIDVGGGSAGGLAGGTVALRAPLLSNGDVAVTIADGAHLRGMRELSLEAYARWDTADASTGALHFDGIVDPAGAFDARGREGATRAHFDFYQQTLMDFVQAPGFVFEDRFAARFTDAAGADVFRARPGIELVNTDAGTVGGDIRVLSDWNLGSGVREASGALRLDYRYRGTIAPVLTLRAAGDVRVEANISDGFFQDDNPFPAAPTAQKDIDAICGGACIDNSPSPVSDAYATPFSRFARSDLSFYIPLPLYAANLAASVDTANPQAPLVATDSSSYRIVAGADAGSADPGALRGAASGSVILDGQVLHEYDKKNFTTVNLMAPRMIRTGTGAITVAAAGDVRLRDYAWDADADGNRVYRTDANGNRVLPEFAIPGVIYTAGRPRAGATGLVRSNVIESVGGLPVVLRTGNVNPEAAGDIVISAGNDIVSIQRVLDDGGRSGRPLANLSQYWWPWMQDGCLFTAACDAAPVGSSINFGAFGQGVLSVGGDVAVAAGRDIRDLSVSLPTTWYTQGTGSARTAITVGGGDLALAAGRDILSGAYFVARGDGRIAAGRDIVSDLHTEIGAPIGTLLALQDTRLAVTAAHAVELGGILNPSYLFRSFDSQAYSADSAVILVAGSGDITLSRVGGEFNYGSRGGLSPAYAFLLPATLDVSALHGAITLSSNGELYPSARGELSLVAEDTIRLFNGTTNNSFLGLIDAAPNRLPSPLSPIFGGALNLSFIDNDAGSPFELHTPRALHAGDATPVRIVSASGDIVNGNGAHQGGLVLAFPKVALLDAGRDIVDLMLRGQNLYASDVTRVRAGRDIVNTPLVPESFVPYIELGGPGTLQIEAGRDIGPLISANNALDLGYLNPTNPSYPGIRTIGNQDNAYLSRNGADILVVFGNARGVADVAYAARYMDPAVVDPSAGVDYMQALIAFVSTAEAEDADAAGAAVTADNALARYRALPAEVRRRFAQSMLYDVLDSAITPLASDPARVAQLVAFVTAAEAELRATEPLTADNALARFAALPLSTQLEFPYKSLFDLLDFVTQVQRDAATRDGSGTVVTTPQAAWDAFRLLPAFQRQRLVYANLYDALNRTGFEYNDPDSPFAQQYSPGYRAIDTLFPAALGYTANALDGGVNGARSTVETGTFDMRGSTVQTQRGGSIAILGPGGDIVVGSASAPPVVPASNSTAGIGPNNQGILALQRGTVNIFADRSVLLAQSRIFTEQGGDILIWSSNADINAGKGAKTSSEVPPPEFLCDFDHFCLVDSTSQVSGAGIAVLQTRSGARSGGANLVAPAGTVDAGDAGIRVAGSLNVAALKVANADNIQVSGGSSGVPTGTVDTGALGAAGSVAASVSQSATQIASARPQEKAALAITVEVLGFGAPGE